MKKYLFVSTVVVLVLIFSAPVFAYSVSVQAKLQNTWEQKGSLWDGAALLFSNFKAGQNKNAGVAKVTRPVVVQEPEWSQQLNSMRAFATSA